MMMITANCIKCFSSSRFVIATVWSKKAWQQLSNTFLIPQRNVFGKPKSYLPTSFSSNNVCRQFKRDALKPSEFALVYHLDNLNFVGYMIRSIPFIVMTPVAFGLFDVFFRDGEHMVHMLKHMISGPPEMPLLGIPYGHTALLVLFAAFMCSTLIRVHNLHLYRIYQSRQSPEKLVGVYSNALGVTRKLNFNADQVAQVAVSSRVPKWVYVLNSNTSPDNFVAFKQVFVGSFRLKGKRFALHGSNFRTAELYHTFTAGVMCKYRPDLTTGLFPYEFAPDMEQRISRRSETELRQRASRAQPITAAKDREVDKTRNDSTQRKTSRRKIARL